MTELQLALIKYRLRDRKNQIGIPDCSEKPLRENCSYRNEYNNK